MPFILSFSNLSFNIVVKELSMQIYTNSISCQNFSYEYSKYNEAVILTISTAMENKELNIGKFDASIAYKGHKEYFNDYIGHAHSEKTLALYAILLGLAKLKRSVPVIVFLEQSILNVKNILDKDVYDQIEAMAIKKGITSLTLIGVQEGRSLLEQFSKE